jgi:isochorismate synthase EntC
MAQDIALSGWGGATDGKAFIVIPCHKVEIAQMVAAACTAESYLKDVRVHDVLPRLSQHNHYALYNACNGRRFFGVSPEQDTYRRNLALLCEHGVPH